VRYVIGIDLGRTHIKAASVGEMAGALGAAQRALAG
jgi:energy-converting hydrogenase Eha subunit A